MEEKQLTPTQAFEVVYRATGALQLNRADAQVLDSSLRVIAQLVPQEEAPIAEPVVESPVKSK